MKQSGLFASAIILVLCTTYAVLHYHLFKGVDWIHYPMYIINKVFSLSGLSMLVLSAIWQLKKRNHMKESEGYMLLFVGTIFIFLHIIISMILISPKVYKALYGNDLTFNWKGELSIFFGVLGLLFIVLFRLLPMILTDAGKIHEMDRIKRSLPPGFLLFGLHVFFPGFQGWFEPKTWPGGMPPVSLLSFLIALIGLVTALKLKRLVARLNRQGSEIRRE